MTSETLLTLLRQAQGDDADGVNQAVVSHAALAKAHVLADARL
ncbi:MAG: hypothetical protein ABI114_05530 [Rhodanobacter sp.]